MASYSVNTFLFIIFRIEDQADHFIGLSLHSDIYHTEYGNKYGKSMAKQRINILKYLNMFSEYRYIAIQRCFLAIGFSIRAG
jgi:hypothetical protein